MEKFEDFLKEGKKIQIKRKYTENHPAATVGKTASVRNEILKAVKDGVLTEEEFTKILSKVSKSPNRWRSSNSKYFFVSEDGVKLSKWGLRILSELDAPALKAFPIHEAIKITKDDWPIIKFKDGGKKYEVEFDDYDVIDDHGNEGKDVYFMGTDQDGKEWTIDASVGYNYENSGNIDDIHYDTLARMDESVTEAKEEPIVALLKLGLFASKGTGEKKLLRLSDDFEEIGDEQADEIASHLNMAIELFQDGYSKDAVSHFKKFNKACKDELALMKKQGLAESVTEAKLSTVHRAAKKGSYPAVIVVVQDGKVIHQEPVSTPDVAPATFNVMQEKYPKAVLHLEDNTGKRLFTESVNEAKAYKLKASEFGADTHSAAYNVKGETTWRVHSTYAIDQVSGENNPEERDVVFFEAMPINNDIYIKIGGINNLKRTNGATVGNNFGTTIEEWKNNPRGIAKEASDFLTDATHLKWINKKARSEGQVIKWALKDDYSSVIEDLVNKSLGLSEGIYAKQSKIQPGDYIQTQYGYFYKRVEGQVGGQDAYVEIKKGKEGKKKTSIHDTVDFDIVDKSIALDESQVTDDKLMNLIPKMPKGYVGKNTGTGEYTISTPDGEDIVLTQSRDKKKWSYEPSNIALKVLEESQVTEKREDVGKYNTVKKVIAKIGRRPSEQELATFITKNYYDVTEVERGDDDPAANDKIADLVAFYKYDIDDWNIAWVDAQNESAKTFKHVKPLNEYFGKYEYGKFTKEFGKIKYPKYVKVKMKELVAGGFLDKIYDNESNYMSFWLNQMGDRKFDTDERKKELGEVGYKLTDMYWHDLTGSTAFMLQGAEAAYEISKHVEDLVANKEDVEPAYYLMKEYFINYNMQVDRSRIFKIAVEKLEKWMEDNAIETL